MKDFMLFLLIISSFSLYAVRTLPSAAVGINKTTCVNYEGFDYHYISFPFVAEGDSAHTLNPTGDKFRCIWAWNPYYQAWHGCSYVPFIQSWISSNRFPIIKGNSYGIAALQCDFQFIKTGVYEILPQYNLVTTNYGTSDMNLIMVPLEKYELKTAGYGIGNDIGSCNQVTRWDPTVQASRVTMLDQYGSNWQWDYSVKIADPIFVNMTGVVAWPYGSKSAGNNIAKRSIAEVNLPKVVYHTVVNSSQDPFDFNNDCPLAFKAWVSGREEDILTDKSFGCGFEQISTFSAVYINLGNFKEKWNNGDVLNIEVIDQEVKGNWKKGKGLFTVDGSIDASFRGFEPLVKDSGMPIILNTVVSEDELLPYETALFQNYPNPFNPETVISFSLRDDCDVKLKVFNYNGQITKELVNGKKEKGYHNIKFNADMLSSGVYFYSLEADGKKLIKKMVLVR